MSEESTPPPLRLKARPRPEGEGPPPSAISPIPLDAVPSDPSAPAALKLRIKPRLDPGAQTQVVHEPDPVATPIIDSAPAEARPFQLRPRAVTPPQPAGSAAPGLSAPVGAPQFKPTAPETIPSSEPGAANPATPVPAFPPAPPRSPIKTSPAPPFPVVAESLTAPRKSAAPAAVPHIRAPMDAPEVDPVAAVDPAPARRPSKKIILLSLTAIVALVIAALGYRKLKSTAATQPAVAVAPVIARPKAAAVETAAPSPIESASQIASLPKRLIDEAKNTVAGRRTLEQDRIDALASGEEPSDKRALKTPPPSTFTPAPPAAKTPVAAAVTSTSQLAPGITVTTTATDIAGDASPAFRAWVAQLKVNGVFNGSPPRALINGRTYRAGQVVDDALGVTFETIDPDAKTIVFRDRSGATASRHY